MLDLNDADAEQDLVDDEVLKDIFRDSRYLFPLRAVEAGNFYLFIHESPCAIAREERKVVEVLVQDPTLVQPASLGEGYVALPN